MSLLRPHARIRVIAMVVMMLALAGAIPALAQNSTPVLSVDRPAYLPPHVTTDRMFIHVVDRTSNTAAANEIITVTITSEGTGVSVTKQLGETAGAVLNSFGEIDLSNAEAGDGTANNNAVGVRFTTDPFGASDGTAGNDAIIPISVPDDTLTVSFTNGIGNTGTTSVRIGSHTGDFSLSTGSILTSDAVNRDGDGTANETNGDDDNVQVALIDPDLNTNAFSRQTVTVEVQAIISGQKTTLALQETGNNTGFFLGGGIVGNSSSAAFTTPMAGDRSTTPPTSLVLGADAAGDTLVVSYQSGTPDIVENGTSQQTAHEIAFVRGNLGSVQLTAASYRIGELMVITVIDPDLDTNPGNIDVIGRGNGDAITDPGELNIVVSGGNGNTEEIELTETGLSTGRFTASLPFNFADAGSADNQLDAGFNVAYRVEYRDGNSGQAQPQTVSATARFTSFSGSVSVSPSTVRNGSVVTITVEDHDLNTDATTVQGIMGAAAPDVSGSGGDAENNIFLRETGVDTGMFTGSFTVTISATAPNNSDGTLNVPSGGSLTVTYADALTATGQENQAVLARAEVGEVNGQVVLDATAYRITHVAIVTLTDRDLNTDPSTVQTVSGENVFAFSATNPNSTDAATSVDAGMSPTDNDPNLFLTETGPDTGTFVGRLTFTTNNANRDGDASLPAMLEVKPGDSVTIRYQDANPAGGLSAATAVIASHTGALTLADSITSGPVRGEMGIPVTLLDADLNTSATTAQSVTVQVLSSSDPIQGITITLTETGKDSGLFSGTFGTAGNRDDAGASQGRIDAADSSASQGLIAAANGDGLEVVYQDASNASGSTETIFVAARVAFTTGSLRLLAATGAARTSFIIGESVLVRYEDREANGDPLRIDRVTAQATSASDFVGTRIDLVETGPDTGVFEGTVALTSGASVAASSVQVAAGGRVEAAVSDLTPAGALFPYVVRRLTAMASIVEGTPVDLSPARLVVEVGETRQLGVTGGFAATIASSDLGTATVSSTGAVTGVAPGSVTITATDPVTGTSASSLVMVVEQGQPLPAEAVNFTLIIPAYLGEGFFSILSVVNNTNEIAKARLTAVQDSGEEIVSAVNSIDPRSAMFDLVEGFFPGATTGFIIIESDTRLQAVLTTEDDGIAALNLLHPVRPHSTQVVPVVIANIPGTDFDTALILLNANDTEAMVSLMAHEGGTVKATLESTVIPPRARVVVSVNEAFPASLDLGLLSSYIEVSSNVDVGVTALITSDLFSMAAAELGQR